MFLCIFEHSCFESISLLNVVIRDLQSRNEMDEMICSKTNKSWRSITGCFNVRPFKTCWNNLTTVRFYLFLLPIPVIDLAVSCHGPFACLYHVIIAWTGSGPVSLKTEWLLTSTAAGPGSVVLMSPGRKFSFPHDNTSILVSPGGMWHDAIGKEEVDYSSIDLFQMFSIWKRSWAVWV